MCQTTRTLRVYQDIADTTSRMLSHAKASQWEQVIKLAPKYQSAVEELQNIGTLSRDQLETRRTLLTQILDNDAAIRNLASPELERLNELISGLTRQRTVLQAYYAPLS